MRYLYEFILDKKYFNLEIIYRLFLFLFKKLVKDHCYNSIYTD